VLTGRMVGRPGRPGSGVLHPVGATSNFLFGDSGPVSTSMRRDAVAQGAGACRSTSPSQDRVNAKIQTLTIRLWSNARNQDALRIRVAPPVWTIRFSFGCFDPIRARRKIVAPENAFVAVAEEISRAKFHLCANSTSGTSRKRMRSRRMRFFLRWTKVQESKSSSCRNARRVLDFPKFHRDKDFKSRAIERLRLRAC
jgi:hypothetical protein